MNSTLTNHADHHAHFTHDALNRHLRGERLTSRLIFKSVRPQIQLSLYEYFLSDESVLEKRYSIHIELIRQQYRGNAQGVIKGIAILNCLYVNPESGDYWISNYRIFEPDGDGNSKLNHVRDTLTTLIADKQLPFAAALMDTWYTTKDLMLFIEPFNKVYYAPIRDNPLVDGVQADIPYRHVSTLDWLELIKGKGKTTKIKSLSKDHKVKLLRVEVSSNRTDLVSKIKFSQDSTAKTQNVSPNTLETRVVAPGNQTTLRHRARPVSSCQNSSKSYRQRYLVS